MSDICDEAFDGPDTSQTKAGQEGLAVNDMTVVMHTDGACLGNPGPGGWAALLNYAGKERTVVGRDADTTNNRMELMAAIGGVEALTRGCSVDLYTDSQYVIKGITEWIHGWKKRGWKTASRAPVKNADLWERLDRANSVHKVSWRWVKGHSGDPGNERVDQLARDEAYAVQAAAGP